MKNGFIIDGVRFAYIEPRNLPDDGLEFCDHCALKKVCDTFYVDSPCHIFENPENYPTLQKREGKLFARVYDVPKRP